MHSSAVSCLNLLTERIWKLASRLVIGLPGAVSNNQELNFQRHATTNPNININPCYSVVTSQKFPCRDKNLL